MKLLASDPAVRDAWVEAYTMLADAMIAATH